MAIMTTDQIGRLAEWIAVIALGRSVMGRYVRPLFRATLLGDKYPVVDCLVDVLDATDRSLGFFFAQVKGTVEPPALGGRLGITIAQKRYNALVRIPVPSYLIGVDIRAEAAYLVAA